MKTSSPVALSLVVLSGLALHVQAQNPTGDAITRPRTVASQTPIQEKPSQKAEPVAPKIPTVPVNVAPPPPISSNPGGSPGGTSVVPQVTPAEAKSSLPGTTSRLLAPSFARTRIAEAERLLKSRPLQTAMTLPSIEFVTLAALEPTSAHIHLITLSKETFLTRGAETTLTSSLGTPLTVRVLRANGVNTAVTIFDPMGHSLVPLVVEFPIEKRGVFREMAYYTSAHPALLSTDLVRAGQTYVSLMIDLAAKRLREKGSFISPQIVDVAMRLCLVEHVDHERFRVENRAALFDEIYSLYALNEIDTYRYSVSTAGAGGMVQMIPWAYNLIRQRHPAVGLNPDFVTGMRNHTNALQAMLLYMQDTWNDLAANEDVQSALSSKLATQTELLAAGYNSNAARLPLYLRRGGSAWRTLIPRETQMYLQIYKTVDSLVPMKARPVAEPTSSGAISGSLQ